MNVAELTLQVDASPLKVAMVQLDALGSAATRAEQRMDVFEGGVSNAVRAASDRLARLQSIAGEEIALHHSVQQQKLAAEEAYATGSAETLKSLFGEQSALYKAAFATEKAQAIATAIISTHTAAANALKQVPFPLNLAAAALVTAKGVAEVAAISGIEFGGGRARGGPVSADEFYEVNEGGRPELLSLAGRTYLMPGGEGRVTPMPELTPVRERSGVTHISIGGVSQVFNGAVTPETRTRIREETETLFDRFRDDVQAMIDRDRLFERGRV